jgi:hypothetical protein
MKTYTRKLAGILPLLLLPFLLTSCFDYVQSVGFKNGKHQMYYKITFSKPLMQLVGQDTQEELLNEESLEEFGSKATLRNIDTDLEFGAEISMELDPKRLDPAEDGDLMELIPMVSGKKCLIPFIAGEKSDFLTDMQDSDDETMGMMVMLLSSLKARVLVDKSLVPKMKAACFEGNGVDDYQIPFYDYGPAWCLEVPLIVLLERESYRLDTIVVLKK